MSYKAAIFDLDGTLADTLEAIANSGNHMLRELGCEPRPVGDFRYLAGQGLRQLVIDALGGDPPAEQVDRGMALVLAYYERRRFDGVRPYEGVIAMLRSLQEAGIRIAVLSNKPHAEAEQVTAELFSQIRFDAVQGALDDRPLKPHPAMAQALLDRLGLDPAEGAYIGDTRVDMITGTQAGLYTIGVTWGFRDEPELRESGAQAIVHHPVEVPPLLLG
jgi:phosphoglycolate phosphatase